MPDVDVPDILFSGLYFPQLQQDLRRYRRLRLPELSDEDPHEPFTQLEDMVAAIGHYMGVLIDHVAREALYRTARLRESVRDHLAIIGEKLARATPSVVDVLCKIPSPQSSDATLKALALFATNPTDTAASILFETQDDLTIYAGNALSYCYEDDGGTFTDRTTKANTDSSTFQPWAGVPADGDALYFGHESVIWDKVWFKYTVEGTVWGASDIALEYYDGQVDTTYPSSVTDELGGTMRLDLTSLLDTSDRHGASVTITSATTGARVTKTSSWGDGINYVDVTIGEMGVGAVDTTATNYLVGAKWREVPSGTLTADATTSQKKYAYTLPETSTRRWQKVSLYDDLAGNAPDDEAYWMRLRVINASATSPTLDRVYINKGAQYFVVSATQGATTTEVVGQSTGGSQQTFISSLDKVVEATVVVDVDEGSGYTTWTEVDNFLNSYATSRHYIVDYDPDGTALVTFGDNANGKIPTTGSNVKLTYRTGAEDDGNVGEGTIVVNRSGFALISSVTNPRAATGWRMAEGATASDLETVKIEKPANLRARRRVMSHADIQAVVREWVDDDGAKPFARATIIDEASGLKTATAVVVESGSAPAPASTLTALSNYLNGDVATDQDGVTILNYQVTVTRYTPKTVNVIATTKGGVQAELEEAIKAFLQPLHAEDDGTYTFEFGGDVYADRITALLINAGARNVPTLTINGVADGDVALGDEELPVYGTVTVTVT